ncbi:putative membrane protein [Rubrobacter radiotolerans]|uniref:DoxX family protein n=1 Tax=Rubrobacter radiotolerans TaxID=42256 RepID=A0A023X1I8_RUBRA|nr:DoxX family protein [Rubrobacter radiotolerans]AHY45880.1 putative membrane protein [Rubrobacter radiotolerans]MDX5893293.1 DoxX family protein [Rubrobacter radiotolerans]SMC03442.1 putative oxidoreductase [Rubrobacter radiotolerans DSM 5868]
MGSVAVGLLLLRVVLGALLIPHGMQKLFGSFGGGGPKGTGAFFEQIGIKPGYAFALAAGLAEFVGGVLIILGFLTPLAAVAVIATMAVAALTVHLKNGFFATAGGYEYNLALIGMALVLLVTGAGVISLDALFGIFW